MAATPAPAASKKKKGTPTWYWVVGGVGVVLAYYLYAKHKAASTPVAAAAPAAGTSDAGTAASSYGNAGDLASLLPYLQPSSAQSATGATTSYVAPTGETVSGSGVGNGGTPITDAAGNTYVGITAAGIAPLTAGGTTIFYQPAPGVFTPVPTNPSEPGSSNPSLSWIQQNLAGGTPLYVKQPSGATS